MKPATVKKSKMAVDYSMGKPDAHCGICRHYTSDDPKVGRCKLVAGLIAPQMWCELFEYMRGPAT